MSDDKCPLTDEEILAAVDAKGVDCWVGNWDRAIATAAYQNGLAEGMERAEEAEARGPSRADVEQFARDLSRYICTRLEREYQWEQYESEMQLGLDRLFPEQEGGK